MPPKYSRSGSDDEGITWGILQLTYSHARLNEEWVPERDQRNRRLTNVDLPPRLVRTIRH